MKGIPSQPRDGVQHRISREMSAPAAVPAPTAAESPPQAEEGDREAPTLAVDGHGVDADASTSSAARG